MPDISMAKEREECYKVKAGSSTIYFHAEEIVEYLGKQYKGEELYKLLTKEC